MQSPGSTTLRDLRRAAVDHTLFPPVTLGEAIERLGFVQADPIRAPARAQDLILRHRVTGYRAGDLERAYPDLPVVEDMVHVYGFLHRRYRPLLHPRRIARTFQVEAAHPHLRRAIVDHLAGHGGGHPRAVQQAVALLHPRAAMINAWGGQSNATTGMLDVLHYRGLLQVVRRERGIRVYALTDRPVEAALAPTKRADGLLELLTRLYAPVSRSTLTQLTLMLGERAMARDKLRARIPVLIRRGVLTEARLDGVDYVWPTDDHPVIARPVVPSVRFLAPFDPLVWDRRRFEHLWQWRYRFEAYTPAARRTLGYYALPLLWDDGDDARVIGWVNVSKSSGKRLSVKPGYAVKRPTDPAFKAAFDAEVVRLTSFVVRDEVAEG